MKKRWNLASLIYDTVEVLIEIKLSTQTYCSCQIHFILQISIGLLKKNHKLELFWLNYKDQCNEKKTVPNKSIVHVNTWRINQEIIF